MYDKLCNNFMLRKIIDDGVSIFDEQKKSLLARTNFFGIRKATNYQFCYKLLDQLL